MKLHHTIDRRDSVSINLMAFREENRIICYSLGGSERVPLGGQQSHLQMCQTSTATPATILRRLPAFVFSLRINCSCVQYGLTNYLCMTRGSASRYLPDPQRAAEKSRNKQASPHEHSQKSTGTKAHPLALAAESRTQDSWGL